MDGNNKIMSLVEETFALYREHKKPIVLGVLAVLALSIPIVVAQVLKQQDLRQHAAAGDPVTLSLSPASASKNINDEFDVQLLINTNTNDISAIDGYLKYDDTKLQLMSKTAGVPYTEIDGTLTDYSPSTGGHTKVQEIILYNQTATLVTGPDQIAATFHFKAIANGVAGMYFGTIDSSKTLKIAASSFTGNVPIANASGQPIADITIGTNTTPTDISPTTIPTTVQGGTNAPTATQPPSATPSVTWGPTATSVPTITIAPGDTSITFRVSLPGIGQGSPNLGLNGTPLHPQREAKVHILNSNNEIVKTIGGMMTYDQSGSFYKNAFPLGSDFPSGTYSVKLRFANTLFKTIPGIIQITSGQNSIIQSLSTLISGDLNGDNTLGIIDWTLMISCIKHETACTEQVRGLADLNDNGTIDELDVQLLQRGFAIRNGD